MKESPKVKGFVTITTKNAETGEVLHSYSDKNIVTTAGITRLTDIISPGGSVTSPSLSKFVFGNDVGTGTEIFPESAKAGYTSNTQDTLFSVEQANIAFSNPTGNMLVAESTISGSNLMDARFPSLISLNVTSGTFRFSDDVVFSYKRFPAIVISRMVDVVVTWEIEFLNT